MPTESLLRYHLYGLLIESNCPLPGAVSTDSTGPVDVGIKLAADQPLPLLPEPRSLLYGSQELDSEGQPIFTINRAGQDSGAYLHMHWQMDVEWIDFVINPEGSVLLGSWSEAVPYEGLMALVLGVVMGSLLRVRGVSCMHASGLAVDGKAALVVGHKGAGKSTLAAFLAGRGYSVLVDDLAPLTPDGDGYLVQPGYARLRLWPSSVDPMPDLSLDDTFPMVEGAVKRYLPLSLDPGAERYRFHPDPLPLAAVYVLEAPDPDCVRPHVADLTAAEALIYLAQNLAGAHLTDPGERARNFNQASLMVDRVRVRRVLRPSGLDALDATVDALVEDVKRQAV